MPSRTTPPQTSARAASTPSTPAARAGKAAPPRGAVVRPGTRSAGGAATAKSPAKAAAKAPAKTAKPAAKAAAKAPAKVPAKAPAKSAAKAPAKAARSAPAKATATKAAPAKSATRTPAKTPVAKSARPARGAASPPAAPDDVLVPRDEAGALSDLLPEAAAEAAFAPQASEPPPIEAATVAPAAADVEIPDAPSAAEPEPPPEDLTPQEWFQREKARRTRPATADVMAEARALLLQAVAEAGPRRGRPVRVGAAAKGKPTKKLAPDEFELEEYRPGEKKAPGET
jgi:hypothetical protein